MGEQPKIREQPTETWVNLIIRKSKEEDHRMGNDVWQVISHLDSSQTATQWLLIASDFSGGNGLSVEVLSTLCYWFHGEQNIGSHKTKRSVGENWSLLTEVKHHVDLCMSDNWYCCQNKVDVCIQFTFEFNGASKHTVRPLYKDKYNLLGSLYISS